MTIFKTLSISAVIKQHIQQLPGHGRGEVTRIAKYLGVSTTLISHVIAGHRYLTPEQAQLLANYLGLMPLEADYLHFLVQYERAGNKALQGFWKAKLEEIKEKSLKLATRVVADKAMTDKESAIFYSSPLYSAIRLYCSTTTKGRNLDEICHRFDIAKTKASELLAFLVGTGLCVSLDGYFKMGIQKTHLEKGSPHLSRHHINWRVHAMKFAEVFTDQELMYTVPISVSKSDFESLREKMVKFIQEFLKQVHDSPAEDIACFNMDFFWIKK